MTFISLRSRHPRLTTGLLLLLVGITNYIAISLAYTGSSFCLGPDQVYWTASMFQNFSQNAAKNGVLSAMYSPEFHCGLPHWFNPVFNPLYPFYFNWTGAESTILETLRRLNYVVIAHLSLLGIGISLITRGIGASRITAFLAGTITPWHPGIPRDPVITSGFTWIPFIIYAQIMMAKRPRSWWPPLLLAASSSALVYAHPAQNLVFAIAASAIYWCCYFIHTIIQTKSRCLPHLAGISLRLACAAGLIILPCGYYLANLIWFHSHAIRWLGDGFGAITGGMTLPIGAMTRYAMRLNECVALLVYDPANTRPVGNLFLGPYLILGFMFSIWLRPTRRSLPLIAISITAALLCFETVVTHVSHSIPLINRVREVGWWSCLIPITAVPMAACGLERFVTLHSRTKSAQRLLLLYSGIAVLVVAYYASLSWPITKSTCIPWVAAALTAATALVIAIRLRDRLINGITLAWFASALTILCCAIPIICAARLTPHSESLAYLQQYDDLHRKAILIARNIPKDSGYRVMVDGACELGKELSMVLGTMGYRVVHVFGHPLLEEKFAKTFYPNETSADRLGIKWVIYGTPPKNARETKALGNDLYMQVRKTAAPYAYYTLSVNDIQYRPLNQTAFGGRTEFTFDAIQGGSIVINEDYRSGLRFVLDGERVSAVASDLLQSEIANVKPGFHTLEIIR